MTDGKKGRQKLTCSFYLVVPVSSIIFCLFKSASYVALAGSGLPLENSETVAAEVFSTQHLASLGLAPSLAKDHVILVLEPVLMTRIHRFPISHQFPLPLSSPHVGSSPLSGAGGHHILSLCPSGSFSPTSLLVLAHPTSPAPG